MAKKDNLFDIYAAFEMEKFNIRVRLDKTTDPQRKKELQDAIDRLDQKMKNLNREIKGLRR